MITFYVFLGKGSPVKVLCFFLILIQQLSYAETLSYRGEAKVKGKIVYKEMHIVTYENGILKFSDTIYSDPQGATLARLSNDYSKSISLPEHLMQDVLHKNKHGLRYLKESPIMFNQDENSKEESKKIDLSDYKGKLVVGGQGLHYYLVKNFEEILKKKTLKLKFVIPGRLDAYDFYLKIVGQSENKIFIEVEIDNWFLKLFAPKLKMTYDLGKKRLLNYSGLSNIRNPDKEIMNVDIEYFYE